MDGFVGQVRGPTRDAANTTGPGRGMSQFIHATPPPATTVVPRAVHAPMRALDAAVWLPLAVAMAQMMAETISISTAVMSTNVRSAPTTSRRSPMPLRPSKSGNTSMAVSFRFAR